MSSRKGRANGRAEAVILVLLIAVLIWASLWLVRARPYWLPELGTSDSVPQAIDNLFNLTLLITGIAFLVTHGLLAYFIWHYRAQAGQRAAYWTDDHRLEIAWTIVPVLILVALVVMGARMWSQARLVEPKNALRVEVTGIQFDWIIRYPGEDGIFGERDAKHSFTSEGDYLDYNKLGLNEDDPNAQDDIVIETGLLHLPAGQPVIIDIRSNDVIHSFFLPQFRVKQDAVPGMTTRVWFNPTKPGTYEIACAELCGLGHYKMRGLMTIENPEDFDTWMEDQVAFGE